MPARRPFGTVTMANGRSGDRAVSCLSMAAAPTFALITAVTMSTGDGYAESLCTQAALVSPLSGMATMYLLMTLFHLKPWLRLTSVRERD